MEKKELWGEPASEQLGCAFPWGHLGCVCKSNQDTCKPSRRDSPDWEEWRRVCGLIKIIWVCEELRLSQSSSFLQVGRKEWNYIFPTNEELG